MTPLPLGRSNVERRYGREPDITLLNRFFEENPSNRIEGVALLGRPGTSFFTAMGEGPIRATFAREGVFGGALFVVSGEELFEHTKAGVTTGIGGTIPGDSYPSMDATREFLWIADGTLLQFYDGVGSRASDVLTLTGTVSPTETVTIAGQAYTFVAGVPAAPYEVSIGSTHEETLDNLAMAVNSDPSGEGTAYGIGTVANDDVTSGWAPVGGSTVEMYARVGGTGGNAITAAETLANGSWATSNFAGGVDDALSGVATPDDVGIVSVCVLGGFTFCAAAQDDIIYFIRPGEIVIDPLDFISAEAVPDEVLSLLTVGDQFWAFGSESTQVFALTGDSDAPAAPIQGRAFSHGIVEGTAILIESSVMLVGDDGMVYNVAGGPTRVSTHAVEEAIRKALVAERDGT